MKYPLVTSTSRREGSRSFLLYPRAVCDDLPGDKIGKWSPKPVEGKGTIGKFTQKALLLTLKNGLCYKSLGIATVMPLVFNPLWLTESCLSLRVVKGIVFATTNDEVGSKNS
jgi:hypothetical protein